MVDQLNSFAPKSPAGARSGNRGQAGRSGASPRRRGTWKDLTDNVNFMASNLTKQNLRRVNKFGVAAIHAVAREQRLSQRFSAPDRQYRTFRPFDAATRCHTVADPKAPRALTLLLHKPTTWWPNHRGFARRQFSFNHVQIGSAHAGRRARAPILHRFSLRRRGNPRTPVDSSQRGWRAQQHAFIMRPQHYLSPFDAPSLVSVAKTQNTTLNQAFGAFSHIFLDKYVCRVAHIHS